MAIKKRIPWRIMYLILVLILWVSYYALFFVHIGNSRIYKYQGAFLRQLTIDHTTQQLLLNKYCFEDSKLVNKNEIYACLGGGSHNLIKPLMVEEIYRDKLKNGVFLLTSDGIHDYVTIEDMERIMNSPDNDTDKALALEREAKNNGSEDDSSIVIIRV